MRAPLVSCMDVDLDHIAGNYNTVREYVSPAAVIATIKTNAYSHGAVAIARVLVDSGCSHLAVSRVTEAIELRNAGVAADKTSLLIMSALLPEEIDIAVEIDASMFIPDFERLEYLQKVAAGRSRPVRFHVKVDTGLGRIGFMPEDGIAVAKKIRNLRNCRLEGIGTHLFASKGDAEHNAQQLILFEEFVSEVNPPSDCLTHIANSAAVLRFPRMIKNAVRVGYLLYGLVTVPDPPVDLTPVLSYRTRVIQVREIPRGWHVGYGAERLVTEPIRTATIPIGTGDGTLTPQINRAHLLVNGKRCMLLGTCADMSMIDITHAGPVKLGDEVVYIGKQGDEKVTALEQRDAAGVGVAALLRPMRVPRVYFRNGIRAGMMSQWCCTGIAGTTRT